MQQPIYIVVAIDQNRGIGKNGILPWHLKDDMRFFKEITLKTKDLTKQNMVIMGRTTWESIPQNHRPLSGRINVVLSSNKNFNALGATVCASIQQALDIADKTVETVFMIGGGMVFKNCIQEDWLTGMYITKIDRSFDCDTFFPEIPEQFSKVTLLGGAEEDSAKYEYLLYEKN